MTHPGVTAPPEARPQPVPPTALASGGVRQWVTRRALLLHLAFVVIASGCLIAGWWQVHRAMAGNTLSYLYSVEWPAFAVVAGIGWWQLVHDTPEDIAERRRFHTAQRAASAAVVARTLPRSALAITVDSEEAGIRQLDAAAVASALPSGDEGGERSPLPDRSAAGTTQGDPRDPALLAPAEEPGDELELYNRYLATLAVRGKAKTWRNPRGT